MKIEKLKIEKLKIWKFSMSCSELPCSDQHVRSKHLLDWNRIIWIGTIHQSIYTPMLLHQYVIWTQVEKKSKFFYVSDLQHLIWKRLSVENYYRQKVKVSLALRVYFHTSFHGHTHTHNRHTNAFHKFPATRGGGN